MRHDNRLSRYSKQISLEGKRPKKSRQDSAGESWDRWKMTGGEGGIRTLGTAKTVRRLSKPVQSTTLPPLRTRSGWTMLTPSVPPPQHVGILPIQEHYSEKERAAGAAISHDLRPLQYRADVYMTESVCYSTSTLFTSKPRMRGPCIPHFRFGTLPVAPQLNPQANHARK
jgi:hypothetical protein